MVLDFICFYTKLIKCHYKKPIFFGMSNHGHECFTKYQDVKVKMALKGRFLYTLHRTLTNFCKNKLTLSLTLMFYLTWTQTQFYFLECLKKHSIAMSISKPSVLTISKSIKVIKITTSISMNLKVLGI